MLHKANAAADKWLTRWNWEPAESARLLTTEQLRSLMRAAFVAGYHTARLDAAITRARRK